MRVAIPHGEETPGPVAAKEMKAGDQQAENLEDVSDSEGEEAALRGPNSEEPTKRPRTPCERSAAVPDASGESTSASSDASKAGEDSSPGKDLMAAAAAAADAAVVDTVITAAPIARHRCAAAEAAAAGLGEALVAAAAARVAMTTDGDASDIVKTPRCFPASPVKLTNIFSVKAEPQAAEKEKVVAEPAWSLKPSVGTWMLLNQAPRALGPAPESSTVQSPQLAAPQLSPETVESAVDAGHKEAFCPEGSPSPLVVQLPCLLPSVGTWMHRPIKAAAMAAVKASSALAVLEEASPALELLDCSAAKEQVAKAVVEAAADPVLKVVAPVIAKVTWSQLPSVGTWLPAVALRTAGPK